MQVEGMTLDPSVLERLEADPESHPATLDEPYRPKNLLRYLKEHPDLQASLGEGVRRAIERA